MREKFLISVILPVYNIANYLPKCMESLFAQSYKNLEYILVDDGSTDESGMLCDGYAAKDARVKVFHKINGGLSDARNFGIKHANGDYITCVDPDDYVDLDYIEYLYYLLEKYSTRMSVCQHRVLFSNGRTKDYGKSGDEKLSNKACLERMLYHDVIDTSAWAKLYERSLFEEVKYPVGKLFEDIGTTYALMLQCETIAIGYESKYTYVLRSNSIVSGKFKPSKLDLLEMTDRMGKDVLKVYPDLRKAVLRRRIYARFSTLNQMLDTNDFQKEKMEIIRFLRHYKTDIIKDPKTPKRDKMAAILLALNYKLYRFCWKQYLLRIKGR